MLLENTILNARYRLERKIGQGKLGQVFVASDLLLQRRVAIKIFNPSQNNREDFLTQFAKETRAVAAFDHTHILTIYDYGHVGETIYLVMPYIHGGTLQDKLQHSQKLSLTQTVAYVNQIAAALDYSHRQNIIHGNLKPTNLLLRAPDNGMLIADFAIYKAIRSYPAGSLACTAPEQIKGFAEFSSDIYALGCLTFFMLTGGLPYSGTLEQVARAHLTSQIPSLVGRSDQTVPPELEQVVERALAKSPADRYPTAGLFALTLQEVANRLEASKHPPLAAVKTSTLPPKVVRSVPALATPPPLRPITAPTKIIRPAKKVVSWPVFAGLMVFSVGLLIWLLIALSAEPPKQPIVTTAREIGTPSPSETLEALAIITVPVVTTPLPAVTPIAAELTPGAGTASDTSLFTLAGHKQSVQALAFNPNGNLLASASADKTVRIWSPYEANPQVQVLNLIFPINALAFSPNGQYLAGGGDDGLVRFWNVQTGVEEFQLRGHKGAVLSLIFAPDGKTLITTSRDKTVRLWEVASRNELRQYLSNQKNEVERIALSPDGTLLAGGDEKGFIYLWDIATGNVKATLYNHVEEVLSLDFNTTGKVLASGGNDNRLNFWEIPSGRLLKFIDTGDEVTTLAFAPDGTLFGAGGGNQPRRWEVPSGIEKGLFVGHEGAIMALSVNAGRSQIATADEKGFIKVWQLTSPFFNPPVFTPLAQVAGVYQDAFNAVPGTTALCVIQANGQTFGVRADASMPSASTIKMWVAATFLDEVKAKRANLDENYVIKAADATSGTGELKNNVGKGYTLRQIVKATLAYSDNTGANILLDKLGGFDKVNEYIRKNGYNQTKLQRRLADIYNAKDNYTSARDAATFMQRLVKGQIVDKASSDLMLEALRDRRNYNLDQNFFGGELPRNLQYYHVSGTNPKTRNEVGFILDGQGEPVVIAVYSNSFSEDEAMVEKLIAKTVSKVYALATTKN